MFVKFIIFAAEMHKFQRFIVDVPSSERSRRAYTHTFVQVYIVTWIWIQRVLDSAPSTGECVWMASKRNNKTSESFSFVCFSYAMDTIFFYWISSKVNNSISLKKASIHSHNNKDKNNWRCCNWVQVKSGEYPFIWQNNGVVREICIHLVRSRKHFTHCNWAN